MMKMILPRASLLLTVLTIGALCTPATIPAAAKPNVILIVSDDQGYADVGFHGSEEIRTPNLDALAASGVICTAGYVTFPVCSPSRAGFLSGRHGARFGYDTNPDQKSEHPHAAGLPLSERTMADAMKGAGYATGLIGKWHLGVEPHQHPNQRGFDQFFGFVGGGHEYWDWQPGNDTYRAPILRNQEIVPDTNKRYLTDLFSDEAVAYVDRHKDEPFFLYLAYNAPHSPLQASPEYLARVPHLEGRRQIYAAMILAVDDGVGRLQAKLKELDLTENTLIYFITDNGGPLQANASNNSPLRGRKSQVWEGGIRVPYVVSWPGHIPAGVRYDKPVSSLDFIPTALAAAGVNTQGMPSMEGVDLLPHLRGDDQTSPHEKLFWRHRNGSWAVREGSWKLVEDPEGNRHLFHIAEDLSEEHNLIGSKPEVASRLLKSWRGWNASNAGCIPWFPQGGSQWPAPVPQ